MGTLYPLVKLFEAEDKVDHSKEKELAGIRIIKEHGFIPSKREFLKTDKGREAWDKLQYHTHEIAKHGDLKITTTQTD